MPTRAGCREVSACLHMEEDRERRLQTRHCLRLAHARGNRESGNNASVVALWYTLCSGSKGARSEVGKGALESRGVSDGSGATDQSSPQLAHTIPDLTLCYSYIHHRYTMSMYQRCPTLYHLPPASWAQRFPWLRNTTVFVTLEPVRCLNH